MEQADNVYKHGLDDAEFDLVQHVRDEEAEYIHARAGICQLGERVLREAELS